MVKSIQRRLSLLFVSFVVLLLISVGATYWGLEAQSQDALVINLAGRQRMLIQQMAKLALETSREEAEAPRILLEEAEEIFDQTLEALRNGGTAPYLSNVEAVLPGTTDPEILEAIDDLDLLWGQFHDYLNSHTSSPAVASSIRVDSFNEQVSLLLEKADKIVRLFQEASIMRVNLVKTIQIGFLLCAIVLLIAGVWVTQRSLLRPLNELKQTAARLGENNLSTPVQVQGPKEIFSLSESFERMRVRLLSSRQELLQLNETLEKIVAQRTMELEALNEVSREITAHLDVDQVLNSVTEKARQLLQADVAALCLMDNDRTWLEIKVLSGPGNAIVGDRVPIQSNFASAILEDERAKICTNDNCNQACRILEKNYQKSHLAAPLQVGGEIIGAFCVGSPEPDQFSSESEESLTKLANTAAVALENARLFSQAERAATLEERNRIAAEMHDGIGQTLSYLGLMTDKVVKFVTEGQSTKAKFQLQETRKTINQATEEIRTAINHLLDHTPVRQDLATALEKAIENFGLQHQCQITWQNQLVKGAFCSGKVTEQVTKIALEALTNVKRHANANQVSVELGILNGEYYLNIIDDGLGFHIPGANKNGHFGLQIIQARAAHINGKISVESEPGTGTKVTLSWPETE